MDKSENQNRTLKKPWPTKDAMEQVYKLKLWGDNESDFYSGLGSHHPKIIIPYLVVVKSFLNSFENPITVCDLGCGDFNIGKELVNLTHKYIGADIVASLIDHNKKTFTAKNLEFQCLDISKDDLPKADCIILKQVLQHLSNAEVQKIVKKLANYKYIILTEHIPKGKFEPNKDIISGQGIRLKKQSGINLLASPFNFKVKEQKELLSVELDEFDGEIVTVLYEVF